ncbi:hypothetical protein QE152_g37307 [Popillia japonica]|uniref:Uncharacterized protein n=1 Tax=Popillia japonica TaxID=7064 RepID=A0AAW1IA05_POPJA
MDIASSGYRCTGIHPFNRNVFSDVDFIASDMTNVPESLSISEPSLPSSQLSEPTPSTSSQTTATDAKQQIPSSQQSIYIRHKLSLTNPLTILRPQLQNFHRFLMLRREERLHEDVKLKK